MVRIVAELESLMRTREAIFREHGIDSVAQYRQLRANRCKLDKDPFGDVFLVVDGWASLRNEFGWLEESITDLAAQGLSFGLHVVLSASRWAEIRPSLKTKSVPPSNCGWEIPPIPNWTANGRGGPPR